MTDSKLLRIIVVNSLVPAEGADAAAIELADRARTLRISLLEAGYNILAVFPPDADLQGHIAQLRPDVIIVDAQSDAALKEVVAATANAPRPIICFSEDGDRGRMHAALEAGVSAYVAAGLSAGANLMTTRLPIRSMSAILRPTARLRKAARPGAMRIGFRGHGVRSTAVIVRPTIERMPRRIVSTSGSSGMR